MAVSVRDLVADKGIAALVYRQPLKPVEGKDTPIFPPTYPAPEKGSHAHNSPYTINQMSDGKLVCDLDSVQSQANRMEVVFSGECRDLIPQHAVKAGSRIVSVTQLPHRVADAAIRATDYQAELHDAFVAMANGDPVPLAKISPTAFIFGAWDSRDTQVRMTRAIRSEIRAHDVSVMTRSAQFSGIFNREELGLSEKEWVKGAEVGFAPTPSVNSHGGIIVHGNIIQNAALHLGILRRYKPNTMLPAYLASLAMMALLKGGREYELRSGCWLVPDGPATFTQVSRSGAETALDVDEDQVIDDAKDLADQWAKSVGVSLGGEGTIHDFKPESAKKMVQAKSKATD